MRGTELVALRGHEDWGKSATYITTHPSVRTWSGSNASHLYIITLEGDVGDSTAGEG